MLAVSVHVTTRMAGPMRKPVGWIAAALFGLVLIAASYGLARWRYGFAPVGAHDFSRSTFALQEYGKGGYSPELLVEPGSPLHERISTWLQSRRGYQPSAITYVPKLTIRNDHVYANLTGGSVIINYSRSGQGAMTQMESQASADDRQLEDELRAALRLFAGD